jgi:hypothetical protein
MKFVVHANHVQWQKEYLPRFVEGLASQGHQVAAVHEQAHPGDHGRSLSLW